MGRKGRAQHSAVSQGGPRLKIRRQTGAAKRGEKHSGSLRGTSRGRGTIRCLEKLCNKRTCLERQRGPTIEGEWGKGKGGAAHGVASLGITRSKLPKGVNRRERSVSKKGRARRALQPCEKPHLKKKEISFLLSRRGHRATGQTEILRGIQRGRAQAR